MIDTAVLIPTLKDALDFAGRQVRNTVERYPDFYPMYTRDGKWKHQGEAWTHWCDGFFPGMMWLIHIRTGDPWFRQQAARYSGRWSRDNTIGRCTTSASSFMSTYHHWYRLTRDATLRAVLIQAGKTMGLRFKEKGRYLSSFIGPESTFIDIMMNVGIMFYAARETQDADLQHRVMEHCLTTRRYLVRGDGSTVHEGIFDLESGEFLRESTHQGLRGDSSWARGTGLVALRFWNRLPVHARPPVPGDAELNADYYIDSTPLHGVPPNDFEAATGPHRQPESSAAAIAASGLLDLAAFTPLRAKSRLYRDTAPADP